MRLARPIAVAALLTTPVVSRAQTDPRSVKFRAASIGVTLRFQSDSLAALAPEMQRVLTQGLERYRLLFGGPPRAATGQASDTLSIVVQSDKFGGGDSDPGVVRLTIGPRPVFGFYDWRLTLLHEALHLWNAESFRYASPREQWFNEGVSEFYALQTATKMGLIDGVEAIRIAATAVGFYTSAFEQDKVSLTTAGAQKRNHYFLVYDGGWTAALVMDRDIRERTKNTKSLDDVMRWMYSNFDAVRMYHTKDVARGIKITTGLNYDSFFARFIDGRVALPVAAALNLGELSMAYDVRRSGISDGPKTDPFLMASLGLKP
jgi:predicted metalloprotease with PDZ domain